MMVDEHGLQMFKVVVIVLLFFMLSSDILFPQVHTSYYFYTIELSKYT